MLTGRPTIFTQELADKICLRISEGESLRAICRDEDMPSCSSVFRWLLDEDKKSFWEQYEKARNVQAEIMFEELLEIADDGSNDWMEKERDGQTSYFINGEAVSRSRLRVDTRKWFLSKVLPKKFGEKLDITSGDKPIPIFGNAIPTDNSNKEDSGVKEED
jgi:hypothetical protein